jgi:hypothetical protein
MLSGFKLSLPVPFPEPFPSQYKVRATDGVVLRDSFSSATNITPAVSYCSSHTGAKSASWCWLFSRRNCVCVWKIGGKWNCERSSNHGKRQTACIHAMKVGLYESALFTFNLGTERRWRKFSLATAFTDGHIVPIISDTPLIPYASRGSIHSVLPYIQKASAVYTDS